MAISKTLKNLFEENNIEYDVEKHKEVFTAQHVAASEHITGYEFAKVVMVKCDGKTLMTVIPAPHEISIQKLKKLGYKKVELADEKEFADLFPDCDVGAMPPFGDLYDLPMYVDESLKEESEIVFNSGNHIETVKIKREDYDSLIGDEAYADISIPPQK